MEINIENFLKETEVFLEEEEKKANNRGGGDNKGPQYPIIYPAVLGGKLSIKLLWNLKSNTVIRRIERHPGFGDNGKQKLPCLKGYGVDCPICETITEIEDKLGAETTGVRKKYGLKSQSIAYAQLIDYNDKYTNMPEKGSIIIFMFPRTIYKQIMSIANQYGENSKMIFATNEGRVLNINTDFKQSMDMYSVSVDPFKTFKSFPTDEEYYQKLEELPDLAETITPKEVTESLTNRINAAVDTMKAEYGLVSSDMPVAETKVEQQVNPQQIIAEQANQQAAAQVVQPTTTQPVQQATPVTTVTMNNVQETTTTEVTMDQKLEEQAKAGRPECFGNYSLSDKKCLLCPCAIDCSDIS